MFEPCSRRRQTPALSNRFRPLSPRRPTRSDDPSRKSPTERWRRPNARQLPERCRLPAVTNLPPRESCRLTTRRCLRSSGGTSCEKPIRIAHAAARVALEVERRRARSHPSALGLTRVPRTSDDADRAGAYRHGRLAWSHAQLVGTPVEHRGLVFFLGELLIALLTLSVSFSEWFVRNWEAF